ncbi:flavin-containing monooxygenase [Azospirillum brasilense]|uniref:flavin-containing monooxygenase n=1 Tax=Azospirillum brasilense TaxID=192 RepID=UPI000E0A2589|nr:NAD(P)/FAD-dependent oxidoreductase [Azospirillum brasilense]
MEGIAHADQGRFDLDALRTKYREERDKRLHPDGNGQYVRTDGRHARFQDDPYTPVRAREARRDDVEVLIVGGGFSGLLAAVHLKETGVRDIRIVERGGDFGGSWYWNRYPGAQCDIESYIYLPLLEETGYIPTKKYSDAPEIFAHCQRIGERYRLYEDALFHTQVRELRWDEAASRWVVTTDRGDEFKARFVCLGDGPLSQPKLPGIPGLERFRGAMFHTSRWDYSYTGGGPDGHLDGLRDKRVGIIGTGATAIQCVPYLAESAGTLCVFQRTPSSVFPRDNRDTDATWAASLPPNWQRDRMRNFNRIASGFNEAVDLVNDGLTHVMSTLRRLPESRDGAPVPPDELERLAELRDFELMEGLRARVDAIVRDPDTAAALKPWYRLFCKRPCFNDGYLQAFNRPNVTLVDTQGKGVARLTETAAVVGDRAYELDCLIVATGFEVGTAYPRRSGFEVFGRNGVTLTEKWAGGLRSLHGLQTSGFPNCFFLGVNQGTFTPNFSHMLYEQSAHLAYIVAEVNRSGRQAVEVTQNGEDQWIDVLNSFPSTILKFQQDCTPGYYNNEGKVDQDGPRRTPSLYGGGSEAFFQILSDWRARGDMAGVRLTG